VTLSGVSDSCEATIWADALERCGSRLELGKPLLIQGKVQNGRGEARFCVERLDALEELRRVSGVRIRVRITGDGVSRQVFSMMLGLFREHPGNMPVFVEMDCGLTGRFYVGESRSIRIKPEKKLLTDLRELLGDSATVSLYLGGGTR
jgi:DNA polymerase III alpha subunit